MSDLTPAKVKSMKVGDLRKELSDRGLQSSGLKSALIDRLSKELEVKEPVVEEKAAEEEVVEEAAEEVAEEAAEVAVEEAVEEATEEATEATEEVVAEEAAPAAEPKKAPSTLAGLLEQISSKSEEELTTFEKDVAARKKRADKFGMTFKLTDSEMQSIRASRFGVQTSKGKRGTELAPADVEKLSKRAKRFGVVTAQSGLGDVEEQKKRDARAKRFE